MQTTEHELIERAQTGDTEAFCELAKSYQRRIMMLALHYCRHPQDAEDLSQEVWLKAYRAIRNFRGESSFHTWLRQIMINTFLNQKRETTMTKGDEKTTVRIEELSGSDETANVLTAFALDVEDDLHRQILVSRVMHALGALTPQQRLIFLLKHREGMTYEEMSRAFNCSTGTVKKSLFRAVTKLRQHLGIDVESNDYTPLAASEKG